MKGRKIKLKKVNIKNKEKGITLTTLAITIIILLILVGTAINLTIGDDGIFTRAIEAQDRYKAEEIIEKMQITKGNTYIDKVGKFDIDGFFDNLVEEGIIADREEIIDNGDGSYTITTEEGYVIDIIEKEEGKDVEIEYVGKGDKVGPRIKEIHVKNKTTSTIEIEVEASNSTGAKYTYSYKKEDEEEYKEAASKIAENTYKYEKLEANKIYNIKVEVENKGIKKEKVINVRTGELPEGAISIGEVVWENGKAKVEVNINKEIEGNLRLEYKINEEGNWIEIQDGGIIENLEHNQTIYVRLTDGTNETEYLSTKIEDNIKPEVSIELGTVTSNSIQVIVNASDKETGLAQTNTYEYFLNNSSQGTSTSNTHTFSNLSKGTYTLKVVVTDKAGNTNEAEIEGTTEEVTSGLQEGAIKFTNQSWINGQASIQVSTNTNYKIEYQLNGTEGTWTEIANNGTINNLAHNTNIYARLTDGINSGEYATASIKDTTKPEVSISLGTITSNSIQVQVTAQDNQTGLTNNYEYFLNGTSQTISSNNIYTYSNLSSGTYTLKVVVTDKAGNTNEAEIEGTTEEVTSGLQEGAIKFTSPIWSEGTASIQVSTNTNYKIEYQLNGTEGAWTEIANNGTINNLAHNTNIYARLTDGINQGEYATASIKDTTKPEVSIRLGTITSNSIQVQVTAQDNQTGLTNNYEYFLNGTSQTISSNNIYTYSNLSSGTYTLKVVVTDKAGNVNEAEITGTTSTIPAGTISGAITFTNPTWSGGRASINVSTNTGYKIEYQINGTEGTWTEISNGGTIGNLAHNTNIYARLTDGINRGEYASTNVRDTIAPTKATVNLNGYTSGSWTRGDVTQSFSSIDNETGIAKYQYSHDGVNVANDLSNTWVINWDGQWNFYIRAVDNAGNVGPWSDMYTIRRDATPPNGFNISISNVTYDGFTINASTSDNTSGINRYDYIVNGELRYSGNINNYPVTGLQSNVDYQVYVNAYDNAGNVVSSNVLSQKVLSKWIASTNQAAATQITINEPSSEQNPTIMRILPYSGQNIGAYITYNQPIVAGSQIQIKYKYKRSSNGNDWYLDFIINPGVEDASERLGRSGNNSVRTYNYTTKNNANNFTFVVQKSNITSSSYYIDFYVYEILINGQKIL